MNIPPQTMTPRSFICDACGHEFTTDSTVSEMEVEFEQNFGASCEEYGEEIASVCDDCYEQILSFNNE